MVRAIEELHAAGVEPDVWKLEGVETVEDCQKVCQAARQGGRDKVGVIILGRGENETKVRHWLQVARQCEGVIGFAVGRTVFWQPLCEYRQKKISRQEAAERISQNYLAFCQLWKGSQ